jgi:glucose-fructose oxidoreductase
VAQNQIRHTREGLADIGDGVWIFNSLPMKKTPSRSARPVRFAVVGLGHIAQAAVLPAFRHARGFAELTALVSDTPVKLRKLGQRYKVKHLCSYDESRDLFTSGQIDAVYIALPNSMHAAWTIRAADAGLHVLCEKPLAVSVHDCERMIDACERNNVQLMTAYRLHFERCNLEVADIVRKKRIGDARYFDSQFSMQVKDGNIRVDRELGGGPEYDIGIYCINAARYVFAAEPTEVFATATNSGDKRFREVPETVHVLMKFPGNRAANIICSFGAADRSRYEIVGTKGSVVCDPAFEYASGLSYELTLGEKKQRKKFAKSDQFAPELIHFAKSLRAGRTVEPSGKEGLIDVAIIEAIHRSIASGGWETLNHAPAKRTRPSLKQQIRRPAVPREPPMVDAESGHS